MKTVAYIFVGAILTAGIGLVLARVMHWPVHGREMLVAGVVAVAASLVALVPSLLAREASPAAQSQAALVGTVVHMFAAMVLGFLIASAGLAGEKTPFLVWLLGYYWATLAALVAGMLRALKSAPATGN